MRQLLVYRHAKAEKAEGGLADRDRRLVPRGQRQCESIASRMAAQNQLPEYVLTSPAHRAGETAERTMQSAGIDVEIREDERLYDATPQSFLSLLQGLPSHVTRVMIVGHNPTVEEFVEHVTGENVEMKTANLAVLESEVQDWREVAPSTRFSLRAHLTPED